MAGRVDQMARGRIDRREHVKLQDLRGASMGMVFQEPLSALNPLHRIGHQIGENLWQHQKNQKLTNKNRGGHSAMNEFKPRIIAPAE